jgi:hypothetical protein
MYAKLRWRTFEEGGRRILPACEGSPPYATVVRFKDSCEPWPPLVAWQLIVEKIRTQTSDYDWEVRVRYLVDEAPSNELVAGREFELYEGGKMVAEGVLTEATG